MRFRIPDFALGALTITILFGVGLLAAFPDMPYALVWIAIVSAGSIVWALGSGFLNRFWPNREGQPRPTSQYPPHSPSANFAALINAIQYEGIANRKEEKREDNGKVLRDYLTILVLGITLIALWKTYWSISDQVGEMQKVYPEIQRQSNSTSDQLDIMKQEGQAMVGPIGITLVNTASADEPLKARLTYRNFGRQPATHFYSVSTARLPPLGAMTQTDIAALPFWKSKAQFDPDSLCEAEQYKIGEVTVYPSDLAFNIDVGIRNGSPVTADYTSTGAMTETSAILDDVVNKLRLYVIMGCFTYNTFDELAFSTWCAMLVPGDGNDISKCRSCFARSEMNPK
jgi:hypothetical protein